MVVFYFSCNILFYDSKRKSKKQKKLIFWYLLLDFCWFDNRFLGAGGFSNSIAAFFFVNLPMKQSRRNFTIHHIYKLFNRVCGDLLGGSNWITIVVHHFGHGYFWISYRNPIVQKIGTSEYTFWLVCIGNGHLIIVTELSLNKMLCNLCHWTQWISVK
jgi:hypothetical protein